MLEETLFRRLDDLRKKPAVDLFELVERSLEVLSATQEALLQQRREIRELTAKVATLEATIAAPRPEREPETYPEHQHERHDREPEAEPEPEAELEAEPEIDAAPELRPPEPALPLQHLVMLSTPDGYRIHVEAGPPPALGKELVYDGVRFVVLNHKGSPFPDDRRRACFAIPGDPSDN